jgi:hypothetical protein
LLADVYLNGKHLEVLWKSPYCINISGAVKSGNNNLIIEDAKTLSNHLTGDARLPKEKRVLSTNIEYVGGPLKKGNLWKDNPLNKSGLIGPVKIFIVESKTINLD